MLSLALADLGSICEGIFHTVPDMSRNFDTISVRPRHERNLMRHISRRTAAMASLKVRTTFGYQAAVLGLSFRDLERSCAQRVTMENRPSKIGVVRRMALSDHWR